MDFRKDARDYVRSLTRVSQEWSKWDECTQERRPEQHHYEFRRSAPFCMLAGLVLGGLALDFSVFGLLVERRNVLSGLLAAVAAVAVFPVGRGGVIDGAGRRVIRWWGWIPKPLFTKTYDFSGFKSVLITLKLGMKGGPSPGRPRVGRIVRRPLYPVTVDGTLILLKPCRWVNGARALAREVGKILNVPVDDMHPDDEDSTH